MRLFNAAMIVGSGFRLPRPELRVLGWLAPLLCAVSCGGTPSASLPTSGRATEPLVTLVQEGPLRPSPWTAYRTMVDARAVRVYLAHDEHPKPLVVLLRGSGCAPLFVVKEDGRWVDTSLFQDIVEPRLDRFHFVMIENPGVEPLHFARGLTVAQQKRVFAESEQTCSQEFRLNETKEARVADVKAVMRGLVGSWARQVLLVGHSEGTQVATGLLHDGAGVSVTAAALLSSTGPTQFFGFYLARGAGNRESLARTFTDMQTLQRAADDDVYDGEPARRWKSYALASTPLDDVRASTVPLYVAHGGREPNLVAADLFALEALRQQPTRPLRYVVVQDGDHAFAAPDGRTRVADLFDDFVAWALNPQKPTDVQVLK